MMKIKSGIALHILLLYIYPNVSTERSFIGIPPRRYNETNKVKKEKVDLCAPYRECNSSSLPSWGKKLCSCDRMCHLYGDCCPNLHEDETFQNGDLTAVVQLASCTNFNIYYGSDSTQYWIVNKCPKHFPEGDVKSNCELEPGPDLLLQVPVTEREYGVIFKNIFCATCHGFQDSVTYYRAEMECNIAREEPPLYSFAYTEGDTGWIHNGDDTEPDEALALFSGYGADTFNDDLSPRSGNYRDVEGTHTVYKSPLDVSNLSNHSVEDVINAAQSCSHYFFPPEQLPLPRKCMPYVDSCPAESTGEEVNEKCLHGNKSLIATTVTENTVYKNKHCALCHGIPEDDHTCIIRDTLRSEHFPDYEMGVAAPIPISIILDFNKGTSNIVGVDDKVSEIKSCPKDQVFDVIRHQCRPVSCAEELILINGTCQLDPSTNQNRSDGNFETNECPVIQMAEDEYVALGNGSVFIFGINVTLDDEEYFTGDNHSIFICSTFFSGNYTDNLNQIEMKFDVVQSVISVIGQTISIIALFILLIVYSTNKNLQNLPGKCLMCLSGALFTAQVLFIVGMFTRSIFGLCAVVGILTHYSFMVAFCWMNVMAFDVWRTFHQQFVASQGKGGKRFVIYSVYALLSPTLLVLLGIILDYAGTASFLQPMYGYVFCWINNKEALLYLFALPLGLLIISNYIFFIMATVSICKASSGTSVLKKSRSGVKRKRLILYIKLSTIMGLTWVFGFMASFTGSSILWYLFVIFNSLQGLFICIAFLCNRKVYRLLREQVSRYSWTSSSGSRTKKTTLDSPPNSHSLNHMDSSNNKGKDTNVSWINGKKDGRGPEPVNL